jgi:vacuolar-type H+-ATPase subunit H
MEWDVVGIVLTFGALSIAVVFFVLWIVEAKKQKLLKAENHELATRCGEREHRISVLEEDLHGTKSSLEKINGQLERYRPVIDAEEKADEIIADAHASLAEARITLGQAKTKAVETVREAETKARDVLQEVLKRSDTQMQKARDEADQMIAEAKAKAIEIASDALDARDRASEYQAVANALKNVIEGYGDEYIVPSQSVLDGLAEEFGFTDAGEKMKQARILSKTMIKEGQAAACDYVEDIRRRTAIAFVVDAFNGKVDTILAKTKAENVGKLRQEILDAFVLVNKNGQAFRNARITEAFRDARLEELRWGAVLVELKNLEREEQRSIKERIREEERARREYEKAIRDAAKDEAKIQAALEKARAEMAQASEDQKAKYEQQLAGLMEKLQEAEARAQRALSMAQQTRSGHVYVISNVGSFGGDVFKIGLTRRLEPLDRVRELGDASVPFSFDIHAMIFSEDAPSLETALHKKFNELRVNKVNSRKEFFRLGLTDIRDAISELGIAAHFTLLARAEEYRETLAMERLPREEMEARLLALMNEEVAEADLTEN